jgi:hypothetical protein
MLPRKPNYPDAKSADPFEDGLEFQDFVCEALARHGIILQNFMSRKFQWSKGENIQGWEIKLDQRCTETRRMSIEVAEKSSCEVRFWTRSGIFSPVDPWLYIQGNRELVAIFSTRWLRRYHDEKNPKIHENRPTVQSFFIPIKFVRNHAVKIIEGDDLLYAPRLSRAAA